MPRHPINKPSDISYAPYNLIGALLNTGPTLLNKAGEYLDHPVEQLNTDAGTIGDFFEGEWNYFAKTPPSQLKSDAKDFFSNPDNYFHAAEDAFTIIAAGKIPILQAQKVSKITIAEDFSLNPMTSSPYAGVRAASEFLIQQGVPRAARVQIINSFEIETLSLKTASSGTYGLRFFDNVNALAKGRYLFPTFTDLTNRVGLALPYEWNNMTHFTQFQIQPGTSYLFGRAAAQGSLEGGSSQMFVPDLLNLNQ